MIKLRIAAAAALLAVTGAAVGGEVSATVGITSDYDFRGVTQTRNDPAFQLGMTYTGDSGIYYGLWGSNVDFQGSGPDATYQNSDLDRPSTELDAFMGFSGEVASLGYDLGVIYYGYPNADNGNNSPEVYAGISKGPASFKVWYSWDWQNESEFYYEGNLAIPMTDGFSMLGHFGYTDSNRNKSLGNYYDWSVGVGYDVNNFTLSMKYVDGSDLDTGVGPKNLGRFVFGVTTTFPWKK